MPGEINLSIHKIWGCLVPRTSFIFRIQSDTFFQRFAEKWSRCPHWWRNYLDLEEPADKIQMAMQMSYSRQQESNPSDASVGNELPAPNKASNAGLHGRSRRTVGNKIHTCIMVAVPWTGTEDYPDAVCVASCWSSQNILLLRVKITRYLESTGREMWHSLRFTSTSFRFVWRNHCL
jgi:hypothetical protein